MSDGFRSAEIGAPVLTYTSACTPECNARDGHAPACAAHLVVYIYGDSVKPELASVFRSYRDLSAPAVTCPHCGGDLGNTTTFSSTT